MIETVEDVEELLREGRESEFVGERESAWLDFKNSPYVLKTEKGKVELAKDVAAMANSGGGCIAVGVTTRKDPSDIDEVADGTKPFPCEMMDAGDYHKVIDGSVYPHIEGLRVESYARSDGCLGLLVVPGQDQDQLPILLRRNVDDEGRRVDAISVPSRSGSHTRWAPVGQIHRDMSDGRRFRRQSLRATFTADLPDSQVAATPMGERMRERASEIEAFMEWEDHAMYVLSAKPSHTPERIKGLYEPGGLRDAFARPPELRHAGFGIGWDSDVQTEDGALVAFDSSRCRWLETDGFFTVALRADQRMLGRSPGRSEQPQRLQIHPTALVEFTYEFCRFVSQQLEDAVGSGYHLGLLLIGAATRPWSLQLGRHSAFQPFADGRAATSNEWVRTLDSTSDPVVDAYRLLVHVYDLFEQPESAIPHAESGRIDVDSILALSE